MEVNERSDEVKLRQKKTGMSQSWHIPVQYKSILLLFLQNIHCIGCNQCVPHCPQNIDIPKELHRIDQFVEQLKQGTL